jgi:hypothetical protein
MFKKIISILLVTGLLLSPVSSFADTWGQTKPPLGSQIDWAHPLSRGLVGAWMMNEGAGIRTINLINNSTGILTNGAYFSKGGISFDGANDFVALPLKRTMLETAQTTIVFSLYPLTTNNYNQTIRVGDGWGSFDFHTTSTGEVYCGIDTPDRFDPGSLPAGTVTIRKDNVFVFTHGFQVPGVSTGMGKFYKNGKLLASKAILASTASWVTLNVGMNSTDTINGSVKYVYVFNRALSPQEIQQLYIDPYSFIKRSYKLYLPTVSTFTYAGTELGGGEFGGEIH